MRDHTKIFKVYFLKMSYLTSSTNQGIFLCNELLCRYSLWSLKSHTHNLWKWVIFENQRQTSDHILEGKLQDQHQGRKTGSEASLYRLICLICEFSQQEKEGSVFRNYFRKNLTSEQDQKVPLSCNQGWLTKRLPRVPEKAN